MSVESIRSTDGKVTGTAVRTTKATDGTSVIIIRRTDTGTVCVLPESQTTLSLPSEQMQKLKDGQKIQWQSDLSTRWYPGRITGSQLEPDGSLTYHLADRDRAHRSITADKVRAVKGATRRRRG